MNDLNHRNVHDVVRALNIELQNKKFKVPTWQTSTFEGLHIEIPKLYRLVIPEKPFGEPRLPSQLILFNAPLPDGYVEELSDEEVKLIKNAGSKFNAKNQ
jgi:hypothetical protein